MKNVLFYGITGFMILVTWLAVAGIVNSRNNDIRFEEEYYAVCEKEYLGKIRDYLNENGLKNSGVMLNRTVYEDGSREYHISIHHDKTERLSETELENIREDLEKQAFPAENASFVFSFT